MERVLPAGFVSLSVAWWQIQSQHPECAALEESRPTDDVEAERAWRKQYEELIDRLEALLLDAISNDELHDLVLIRNPDRTWTEHRLPRSYWRNVDGSTPTFATLSFSNGDVFGMILSDVDRHLDGAPLVFREHEWQEWLKRAISRAQPEGINPDAFGMTFWTLMQAVAWVFLRDGDVVQRVTGEARSSGRYYAEVLLAGGRKVMASQSAGPATDLNLDLRAAARGGALFKNAVEAGDAILEQMRAGRLVGYGRENGVGGTMEIPPISIIDAKVSFCPDQIGPDFGTATRWRDVRFRRSDVLRLWPQEGGAVAESAEPEKLGRASRTVSRQEFETWYRQRIATCEAEGETPTREDDEKAAAAAFGRGVRESVRQLRRDLAPADWTKTGNKGRKRSGHSGKK